MKKFLSKYSSFLIMVGIIVFMIYMTAIAIGQKEPAAIINTTELERQAALNLKLDQVLGVLIDELYEEKRARAICEETVDRWAHDARTRQEVKNEARRLRERGKKKGAKK